MALSCRILLNDQQQSVSRTGLTIPEMYPTRHSILFILSSDALKLIWWSHHDDAITTLDCNDEYLPPVALLTAGSLVEMMIVSSLSFLY
jgi:hypothetical protein